MIALAIALLGLPDLRQKADLHVYSEPAGIHVTVYGQACLTPCTVAIPTGARITYSVEPGWRVTGGQGTRWVPTFNPLAPYRLDPDTVTIQLAPAPAAAPN